MNSTIWNPLFIEDFCGGLVLAVTPSDVPGFLLLSVLRTRRVSLRVYHADGRQVS